MKSRHTQRTKLLTLAASVSLVLVTGIWSGGASSASPTGGLSATKVGLKQVGSSAPLTGGLTGGELRPPDADSVAEIGKAVANRSPNARAKSTRVVPPPSGIAPTQSLSVQSGESGFEGINHFKQRYTDGGNQYSGSPPDQGLCAGAGQVVEAVNSAIQVYDTAGNALTDVVSVNQFYFHDHGYDRSTGVPSPHGLGDLTCVYDAGSNRFYMVTFDLVTDAAGNLTGPSFTDIAVSPVGTALGAWSIFQLDTTNDGKNGTPAHPNCPCFGDYPHIGTDANGFYLTTNEFPTLVDGYNGANVYAISKAALAGNGGSLSAAMFNTARTDQTQGGVWDGFTLAPALSAGTNYAPNTMYFLSSDAIVGDTVVTSTQVLVWKLSNTSALASNPAALTLTHTTAPVNGYYPPPPSDQKAGSVPLAACLNVTSCAKRVLGTPDKFKEYESVFDSSDTRMLQSAWANGKLWGALGTAVDIGGATKAGIAYFVIDPTTSTTIKQGTLAVSGNNISYPALGVTAAGKAVMAMTLVGRDYYPSAAYIRIDDNPANPAGPVTVVGAGQGPSDDFTGYRGFGYNRPRWGDYGAASVVGDTVWIASEYIAQTCSLSQYVAAPFGTCGGTRTILANWSTHLAAVDTAP
jgi:hypothetical protein